MPLPTYKRKFTPRQRNGLVDDAVRGVFTPMGQGQKFEEALWQLARNPERTEEDIAVVRDMTGYNWRAVLQSAQDASSSARQLTATHVTNNGKLAANIREGVYLIDGMLPLSDLEANLHGIELRPLPEDADNVRPSFSITEGMLSMALAYQHPALAH